jgi:hypothetical protein
MVTWYSSTLRLAALLIGVSISLGAAESVAVLADALPDPGFEQAALVWSRWPAETSSTAQLDAAVAHSGRQSLRLHAVASDDRLFPNVAAQGLEGGKFYRVTLFARRSQTVAPEAITVHLNVTMAPPGTAAQRLQPMMPEWLPAGDWERWTGVFHLPVGTAAVQFCLGLQNAVGDVWIDDVTVADLGQSSGQASTLWRTVSLGVEIGSEPLKRYAGHKAANDTVYQSAGEYNRLLFRAAFAENALRHAERRLFYAGGEAPAELGAALQELEGALAAAYDGYAAAFGRGVEANWSTFRDAARRLEAACASVETAAARETAATQAARPVPLPTHLGRQDRTVPPFGPDGRMNRLLFGAWSPLEFREQEAPFEFEFHSSIPGSPPDDTREEPDFSFIKTACDRLEEQGYRGSFGYLMFGIHDRLYAPKWLLDKHGADPDLFRVSWDGLKAVRDDGNLQRLNYFHPIVQRFIDRYLEQYASACRSEPRVLFYETSQEAYPGFAAEGGKQRQTGYGPAALAEFRAWLTAQYKTIGALNAAWGSAYADFAAIEPAADANAKPDRPRDPLAAEFERFCETAYMDYLARCYQALKRGDPDRPVAARHSSLIRNINGARVFETCDVLSCHSDAPHMSLMTVYANSLNRYHHKALGYLEDFWGVQEQGSRPWDERIQRAGLQAHVQRMCIWGRTLQMKWYAYTAGSYLFAYNGNWFDPRYDVTTLRYCAPALAVAKRAMERVDWVLTHSQIVPARLLVIQPSVAMRLERPARRVYSAILDLHRVLSAGGMLYELLPEEYIEDGRADLAGFAVVLLPEATYLSPGLQRRLAAYVANGGVVVAVGQPGAYDHLARPSGEFLTAVTAAVSTDRRPGLAQAWGKPIPAAEPGGIPTFAAGAGQLMAISGSQALLTPAGKADLLRLIAKHAQPEVWSRNRQFETVLRTTEDGERYLFVLNPSAEARREDVVCLRQGPTSVVDVSVDGGAPVPVVSTEGIAGLCLRLQPGEAAVLWLRKP